MPVIITDTRTVPDGADTTTGWVGSAALTLFTTDPNPVELTGCIGMAVSTSTDDIYFGITAVDLTDTLVYVWVLANGTMDTLTNGGIALQLYDGTDGIGFHLAGSDEAAFRHAEGPVGWQCLLLDTSILPAIATAYSGAVANLTITAITGIGAGYKTLSKALGGASNCFTDILRYGNDGLIITGGTGSPAGTGRFDEIAFEDRSDVDLHAYGIIRELGSGLFGLQGPLTFGDTVGTATTHFADVNTTVTFEDRGIGTNKYYIDVVGNATGSTTFQLGEKTGTTGGSNGCTLSCPPGIGASFTASDVDLQFLLLYGSTFSGFENGMTFSTDGTNSPNHEIFASVFNSNGQISPGLVNFKNNLISTSTNDTGSLLLPSSTARMSDLQFVSDGTGHAIYITTPGTYDFTNFTYSGFTGAGSPPTNAVVYNDSGGLVTINVLGGDSPSVRNAVGSPISTTVVNNSVTLLIQGVTEGAACKILANETVGTVTIGDILLEQLANSAGEASASLNYEGAFEPTGLDIITRVRSSGLPTAAIQDDNGVFTDETTAANSAVAADMNLLPTTPVVNEDRYLFGHAEKFNNMKIGINTAGTGGFTITWQYWSGGSPGGWTNLTGVIDDTNSFSVTGTNYVSFTLPSDWATSTINLQGPYYYIRAAYTAGTVTIVPLGTRCSLDVDKYLPFVQNGTVTTDGLTVTASWNRDTIATF